MKKLGNLLTINVAPACFYFFAFLLIGLNIDVRKIYILQCFKFITKHALAPENATDLVETIPTHNNTV